MNTRTRARASAGDVPTEAGAELAAIAIVTMALFPFAVPAIVLTAAAVAPALVLAALAGVVGALVAAPVVLARGLRRRSMPIGLAQGQAAVHGSAVVSW